MKIKIIKGKNPKQSGLVEEIVRKLFPQVQIESKLNFKLSELEGSIVLEAASLTGNTKKAVALKILEIVGVGISEKVLESL